MSTVKAKRVLMKSIVVVDDNVFSFLFFRNGDAVDLVLLQLEAALLPLLPLLMARFMLVPVLPWRWRLRTRKRVMMALQASLLQLQLRLAGLVCPDDLAAVYRNYIRTSVHPYAERSSLSV